VQLVPSSELIRRQDKVNRKPSLSFRRGKLQQVGGLHWRPLEIDQFLPPWFKYRCRILRGSLHCEVPRPRRVFQEGHQGHEEIVRVQDTGVARQRQQSCVLAQVPQECDACDADPEPNILPLLCERLLDRTWGRCPPGVVLRSCSSFRQSLALFRSTAACGLVCIVGTFLLPTSPRLTARTGCSLLLVSAATYKAREKYCWKQYATHALDRFGQTAMVLLTGQSALPSAEIYNPQGQQAHLPVPQPHANGRRKPLASSRERLHDASSSTPSRNLRS